MTNGDPTFDDVVAEIYEATLEPERWNHVLDSVADLVNARGTYLWAGSRNPEQVLWGAVGRIPHEIAEEYARTYYAIDIRAPPALELPVGSVCTEESLFGAAEFQRSAIYNEFLRKIDLPHIAASYVDKTATNTIAFSVQRTARQGPFDRSECELLARIGRHIARAVRIDQLLGTQQSKIEALGQCFSALSQAVVAIDSSGRIAEMNGCATRIFALRDGLDVRERCLAAARNDDDRMLASLVLRAVGGRPAIHYASGGTALIRRPSGRAPWQVAALPVAARQSSLFGTEIAALLVITESATAGAVDSSLIATMLQLTVREAEVALFIYQGLPPSAIAQRHEVSVHTVRSQLKSIFAKVGVRRQADLVRRLTETLESFRRPRQCD